MPIPAGVTHVVYGGPLPGGEQWESGFWTQGANPESASVANELAGLWFAQLTASDASGALRLSLNQIGSPGVTITYVRVYVYNVAGNTATIVGYHQGTGPTNSNYEQCGNQSALVVSLRSDYAGRAHRGRMYLPATYLGSLTAGNIAAGICTTIANAWATCFTDWNTSQDNGTVVVVSRTGGGGAVPVTSVTVDSVPDTQRRRRDKLIATTNAVAVVTGQ